MRRPPFAFAVILGMAGARPSAGQLPVRPPDPREQARDSAEIRDDARSAQAAFERRRVRYLPWAGFGSGSGSECLEVVGRFCVTDDGGDWLLPPEDPALTAAREELLAELDRLQHVAPGDGWLLGQRVWYRIETGRWGEALRVAAACGGVEPWWCAALQGLAYHGLGRYVDAEEAFERSLALMAPGQSREWRVPRRTVTGDARKALVGGSGQAREETLALLWLLADPLYLVPGNDRRTAHYARWTVSTLKEDARNPFLLRWGDDLEELTLRHGWEVGWERVRRPAFSASGDGVLSHDHPEGRGFLPRGDALRDPARASPDDLRPGRARTRSLYAPDYAPVLLPLDGQVAVFPRGDSMAVVATHYLPEDTTHRKDGEGVRPWLEPGAQRDMSDRAGLFLVPLDTAGPGMPAARGGPRGTVQWTTDGVSVAVAPAGEYVVSVEAWSPPARRAGRRRQGLVHRPVPPDVPALSDLLLVHGGGPEPASLEEAARGALLRPHLLPGDDVAIVWEMSGLGWRPESVTYDLVVEKEGGGFLRGVARRLGLVGRDRPLVLSWTEPGPERPRRMLRRVALAVPPLTAGTYRVRLRARIPGRAALKSETGFLVSQGAH